MDKTYISGSDNFVSPYLRRRLRPLVEVLHGDKRPGLGAGDSDAESSPDGRVGGLAAAATATSSSQNKRSGQNHAD